MKGLGGAAMGGAPALSAAGSLPCYRDAARLQALTCRFACSARMATAQPQGLSPPQPTTHIHTPRLAPLHPTPLKHTAGAMWRGLKPGSCPLARLGRSETGC